MIHSSRRLRGNFNKGRSLFAVLLPAILMITCAPMTTSFYRPDAQDGRVVRGQCPPVHSFILFERNNVIVAAKASYPSEDQIIVTVTFEVPENNVVHLIDKTVEVSTPSQGTFKGVLSGYIWTSPGRTSDFQSEMPLTGKTKKNLFLDQVTFYGVTEHAYYAFNASLSMPFTEMFLLRLPRFLVNNIEVELPLINFRHTSESYIGSLNC